MTTLSRKDQIFQKTKNVGGKRIVVKSQPNTPKIDLKKFLNTEFKQNELSNTVLNKCYFQSKEECHTISNPKIQSIVKGKKNHLCFLIQGKDQVVKKDLSVEDKEVDKHKDVEEIEDEEEDLQ